MKVYKLEVCVIDFDDVGAEDIQNILENTRYPNRCISPAVKKIESRDIGEWYDEHPLNKHETAEGEYKRLFESGVSFCCGVEPVLKDASDAYAGAARYECPKCKKTTLPVYSAFAGKSTAIMAAQEWNKLCNE